MRNARMTGLIVVLLISAFTATAFAANISGTSGITFNQTQINISRGSSAIVSYTVNLVNGSTGETNLTINNKATLAAQNITVNASLVSGNHTYVGALTITVGSNAIPGKYFVLVTATGLAPSKTSAVLPFVIPGNSVQTSTVPPPVTGKTNGTTAPPPGIVTINTTSTTTTVQSTSSLPTTTVPAQQQTSSGWIVPLVGVAAAILIIAGIWQIWKWMRGRPTNPGNQS